MKILMLHVDWIEYEPIKEEIGLAEETKKEKRRFENILVLLTCVEKNDDLSVAKKAIDEAKKILDNLAINKILIYPYAHLSKDLSDPVTSLQLLKRMEEFGKEIGIETYRAPFGWTKKLSFSVKGHPLAEQLREIKKDGGKVEEKKIEKKYFILTKDGNLVDIKEYKFDKDDEEFKILVEQEAFGINRKENPRPTYLEIAKKIGLEWEEFSDIGHMRYGPYASFIMDLLAEYVSRVVKSLPFPVYFVKGTNMFDLKQRAIAEHASLFGQRMYLVDSEERKLVMRYAACFQQFSIAKDWQISYKNLPFGMFEIADSYRHEQSGETLLCFRMRKFWMPDLHVFCKDLEEAKEIFLILHNKIHNEIEKFGRKYVSLYNISSIEFYEKNREFFQKLMEKERDSVLVCVYPPGVKYYWTLNIEYHIIDELGRAREIGTVQIDIGNAERFGIKYVDEKGENKYPIILHSAILGSLERFLYVILDNAVREKRLPLWVSPVQVRVLPVSERFLNSAREISLLLKKEGIRVQLDDRNETLDKKIRDAEINWINYIVVIGEKEVNKGVISVREKTGKIREMKLEELISEIKEKTRDYPKMEISLPLEISKMPKF
ncbi:MAG: threonine--tRNA ligase [Candidatus Aenigmatarchaeota archaeon]